MPDKKSVVIQDEMPQAAPPTATPCCPPGFEMRLDSPKDLWDAVGHVCFVFRVPDLDEALVKVGEGVAFWAAVREDFATEFAKADVMSEKQANMLKRLMGVKELPEAVLALSKADASVKIEELMAAEKKPAPAATGNRFERKQEAPAPRAKDGGYKTGGAGASEATIQYAERIAKKKGLTLPNDFVMWSQAEASAWIQDNK